MHNKKDLKLRGDKIIKNWAKIKKVSGIKIILPIEKTYIERSFFLFWYIANNLFFCEMVFNSATHIKNYTHKTAFNPCFFFKNMLYRSNES